MLLKQRCILEKRPNLQIRIQQRQLCEAVLHAQKSWSTNYGGLDDISVRTYKIQLISYYFEDS